jgi:hypothetical protein
MSGKTVSWKGVLARACDDQECKTSLLKLARMTFKAGDKGDAAGISKMWLSRAKETAQWAMSPEAGVGQLLESTDLPDEWAQTVGEINKAMLTGVDFTKISSYHSMTKAVGMIERSRAEAAKKGGKKGGDKPAEPVAEPVAEPADPNAETPAEAMIRLAEEADEGGEQNLANGPEAEIPVLDDPVTEGEPAGEELEPLTEHQDEPEPAKPAAPKPEPQATKQETEDLAMAKAFVEAALQSGQSLDPSNLVMAPIHIIAGIKQFYELTESKQKKIAPAVNALIATAYKNHLKEQEKSQQNIEAARKRAKNKELGRVAAHGEAAVELPAAANDAPPKRTAKEESVGSGISDDEFLTLIS